MSECVNSKRKARQRIEIYGGMFIVLKHFARQIVAVWTGLCKWNIPMNILIWCAWLAYPASLAKPTHTFTPTQIHRVTDRHTCKHFPHWRWRWNCWKFSTTLKIGKSATCSLFFSLSPGSRRFFYYYFNIAPASSHMLLLLLFHNRSDKHTHIKTFTLWYSMLSETRRHTDTHSKADIDIA